MNPQEPDQPLSDLPGDASPAAEAKPRRKRSLRAAAADAPDSAAAVDAPAVAAVDEAPKPKRARRKTTDAAVAEAAVADVPVTPPVDAEASALAPVKVPRPRRRAAPVDAVMADEPGAPAETAAPAAAAVSPAAIAEPVAAPLAPEPVVAAPPAAAVPVSEPAAAETAPAAPAVAGAAVVEGGEAAEGEGPRRRNRNRRRGRRGGADRALREDGTPADDVTVLTVSAAQEDDDDEAPAPVAEAPRSTPLDAGETFAAVLSGDYDAEPVELTTAEPEKRVLAAEPDAPKLHKVLAQAGIGSRRDMEELIAEGQVTVNGQVAHTGQRISFGDRISVAGKQIKVRIAPPPPRIIAYHKPVGEVVTHDDPQHRPTVFRRLPRLPHGKWQSVGRLDINTEGLLLFTNSGELANQLMHPRFGVEREYAVRVLGTLEAEAKARLLDGVEIDGQRSSFKSIEDGGGEGVNHWYRVVITEGRNREVRKLFDKVGLGVSRLIRIRYGCVVLPRGLKRGVFIDLNESDVREVRRLASPDRAGAGPRPPRPERQERQERGERADDAGAAQAPRDGGGAPRGNNNNRRGGPPQQQRAGGDRPDRQAGRPNERRERAPERDRAPDRERAHDPDREIENFAAIPNPLMQTFDKRAIREARAPKREYSEDGPIPNPLEQTYDKRFVQKGKSPFGTGGGGGRKGGGGGAGGGQPDPMKTSLGYIGADAFVRKFQGNGGGGGGGGGGGRRGGGGGGGGGGGRRGGGR